MSDSFTLDDFRKQMAMIAKPSLMQKMMGMLPGMGDMRKAIGECDSSEMNTLLGIIDSMTPGEKADVKLIDQGRCCRIASGSGVEPHQVSELIKMYEPMAQMMTSIAGKSFGERMNMFKNFQNHLPDSHRGYDDPYRFPRDDEDENPIDEA